VSSWLRSTIFATRAGKVDFRTRRKGRTISVIADGE
jgi:ribosomal protein L27